MSIETLPISPFAKRPERDAESLSESYELPYIIDNEVNGLGSRAVIEYGDLIALTTDSLLATGYDTSKCFDKTIVNWLKYHCETFPTDGITIIAKESDWDPSWHKEGTPWFGQFEQLQRNHDILQAAVGSSLPVGKRPQVELFIEDRLLWRGIPEPLSNF